MVRGGLHPAPGVEADREVHSAAVDAYCEVTAVSDSVVFLVPVEYAQPHHHLLLQVQRRNFLISIQSKITLQTILPFQYVHATNNLTKKFCQMKLIFCIPDLLYTSSYFGNLHKRIFRSNRCQHIFCSGHDRSV